MDFDFWRIWVINNIFRIVILEEKVEQIISKSVAETQKIAADLAKKLSSGEILALSGDLGGGKTTFVQGLAKGLGIKEQITSPTFVLIKEFKISRSYKLEAKNLIHIDLYRLKKIDKIFKKEIQEYFKPENITVIEWAEKIKDSLPKNTKWIKFNFISENKRRIKYDFSN